MSHINNHSVANVIRTNRCIDIVSWTGNNTFIENEHIATTRTLEKN